jgi:alginate O-acetyltransferase complex protein AlgI
MQLSTLFLGGRYDTMTSYFSIAFLVIFLPVCLILYSLLPQKLRKYFLLAASYGFFWLVSGKLVIYLLLTTLSIHYFGLWLDRIHRTRNEAVKGVEKAERKEIKKRFLKQSRWVLAFAIVLHIGVLLTLKYSPFFTTNLNAVFTMLKLPLQLQVPSYLMPIGISFFTLQAVSYLIDVYRETIPADDNIFRLGLFMSFFPQIVEGPICRYDQTAQQLWEVKGIEYHNLSLGLQRVAFGLMKKLVIADRLNPLVKEVFANYADYEGGVIALASLCYTIQLYMDFSGTMDAVMGIGQIFGVSMPENFKRPFFSKTISEFWMRWHISLGAWFKDYIFYPVTMSKPMKKLTTAARKKLGNHFGPLLAGAVALFLVWLCNGLWHGAGWNYIFFGMYHFGFILLGNIVAPAVKWLHRKCHINPEWFGYRVFQIIRTGILVVIGEMFFRASTLQAGFAMLRQMVTNFRFATLNGDLLKQMGVDWKDMGIVLVTILIIFAISVWNEKGVIVREALAKKPVVVRWAVLYALILFIVIFGAYGAGYIPVDPIYANF